MLADVLLAVLLVLLAFAAAYELGSRRERYRLEHRLATQARLALRSHRIERQAKRLLQRLADEDNAKDHATRLHKRRWRESTADTLARVLEEAP